jgi:hypothetical protein
MFVKKPIGVGLVIGLLALAFTALPAMAQAAPTLKDSKGTLPIGSTVLATSSNLVTVTPTGTLTCEEVTLDGIVTSNPAAALEGEGEANGCLVNGAAPVNIESILFTDEFFAGGTDAGEVLFTYSIPAAGLSGCFLEGGIATTWTNGSDIVKVTKSHLTGGGGSAGCPEEGDITGELTLETEDGTAVTVNE